MPAKSAIDIQGFEYDWLATDGAGRVALFTTAGGGYAPPELLEDTDAHEEAIDAILALPASTQPLFAPQFKAGFPNAWRDVAARGLFAFDADVFGGSYKVEAAPATPITIDELPEPIASVARKVTIKSLDFAGASEVTKAEIERR